MKQLLANIIADIASANNCQERIFQSPRGDSKRWLSGTGWEYCFASSNSSWWSTVLSLMRTSTYHWRWNWYSWTACIYSRGLRKWRTLIDLITKHDSDKLYSSRASRMGGLVARDCMLNWSTRVLVGRWNCLNLFVVNLSTPMKRPQSWTFSSGERSERSVFHAAIIKSQAEYEWSRELLNKYQIRETLQIHLLKESNTM